MTTPTTPALTEARGETKSGAQLYAELCNWLIDQEGHNHLYPEIARTRSSDWMAIIFEHHDEARRKKLASGQAETMDEACAACVADYKERQRINERKEQLLKEPMVLEALELFNKGKS